MKKAVFLLMLFSSLCTAADIIISDPVDPRATHCGFWIDSRAKVITPVQPTADGNICYYDFTALNLIRGVNHQATATAIIMNGTTIVQESVRSSPVYNFVLPVVPLPSPQNIKLK